MQPSFAVGMNQSARPTKPFNVVFTKETIHKGWFTAARGEEKHVHLPKSLYLHLNHL